MDCAPLNLAHFHERRANKFMRNHRYDDAYKAVETSVLYLQDAYKHVTIPKSIEVLNTQKWEYERKLRQIQMRKQQHERLKSKEIVPLNEVNHQLRVETNVEVLASATAQSIARSIDKTVKDFDARFNVTLEQNLRRLQIGKENILEPRTGTEMPMQPLTQPTTRPMHAQLHSAEVNDDMPSLVPLELPAFDFDMFSTSGSVAGLAESFQK